MIDDPTQQHVDFDALPILLVEDNDDDLLIFTRAFAEAGIKNPLHVVMDGLQARDYLKGAGEFSDRKKHPFPFLLLLDLKLPFLSGLELLEWHRRHASDSELQVIVLTNSDEERDITRAYHLGARSYLTKPTTARKLREIVAVLRESFLTKQAIGRLQLTDDLFASRRRAA